MSELNKHHDDGEQDRSQGRDYDPPNDILDDLLDYLNPFSGTGGFQERNDENEAYNKGWTNTDNQKK